MTDEAKKRACENITKTLNGVMKVLRTDNEDTHAVIQYLDFSHMNVELHKEVDTIPNALRSKDNRDLGKAKGSSNIIMAQIVVPNEFTDGFEYAIDKLVEDLKRANEWWHNVLYDSMMSNASTYLNFFRLVTHDLRWAYVDKSVSNCVVFDIYLIF